MYPPLLTGALGTGVYPPCVGVGYTAFIYSEGHAVACIPGVPGGPVRACRACGAVYVGTANACAALAVCAYELVDGIPNGKNTLTLYSD